MIKRVLAVLIFLGFAVGTTQAATVTLRGYFDDPANTALVGYDLGPPLFGDDWEIANNVALYPLSVPIAGLVTFTSYGYAAGGADPYFTLFQGNGAAATFLGSNYAQAFSTGGDFSIAFDLAAGGYQIAMSVFANMSVSENYGSGTLGDGFSAFGMPGDQRSWYYELGVTLPDQPQVAEPCTLLLTVPGLVGLAGLRKKMRRQNGVIICGRSCGRLL